MIFLPLIECGSKTTDLLSLTYLERVITILNAHEFYSVFWADHTGKSVRLQGVFVFWRCKSQQAGAQLSLLFMDLVEQSTGMFGRYNLVAGCFFCSLTCIWL